MIIPIAFAHSVPDHIRDWATEQTNHVETSKVRQAVSDRIRRLVSYNTDKSLWAPLLKLQDRSPALNLMGLLQSAVTSPSEFQRLSKEPIHLVKQDAADLARRAQQMARQLRKLMGRVSLPNRYALSLFGVALTAAEESTDPLHNILLADSQLQAELLDFERYAPDLPALVVAMSATLKKIANDEAKLRPRKMQAATAERTFVIVTLKRYFQKAIGRTPNLIVANIANLTLDLKGINTDTVRKARH